VIQCRLSPCSTASLGPADFLWRIPFKLPFLPMFLVSRPSNRPVFSTFPDVSLLSFPLTTDLNKPPPPLCCLGAFLRSPPPSPSRRRLSRLAILLGVVVRPSLSEMKRRPFFFYCSPPPPGCAGFFPFLASVPKFCGAIPPDLWAV